MIPWIVAEIDSQLEVSRAITEEWRDELERHCKFKNYRLWLISPEGFSDEALAVLKERNAFGSSRKQVTLLAELLNTAVAPDKTTYPGKGGKEYEITIPMDVGAEWVAAHTIEDITRRHKFPAKAIGQIKHAVVEACINADEHSHSPDRRIHLKSVVTADKIVITVTNRGVKWTEPTAATTRPEPTEGLRGQGLKIMRSLMDDVRIEQSDDCTRITMTKSITPQ